ncbi:hypothetical protein [Stutzerimonas stutzeri]|uniref:Uncharacterized protein n=1 Tax=Stutzerimonas stutzeri KOS6 TaxID=1218352 RepID=A0A061JPQ3_STUST|nr:hypothetical protein [Stutzerimonas stutzeri]EWC40169.1 hypothetical protein B597_016465 [Stutzerimonas stutzeri KOS6]
MDDLFLLQDSRSNVGSRAMFWRLGGGYTSNLDEAEQFSREMAVRQYECRETDLPWPVNYVRALAEVGVDHQYIDDADAQAFDQADDQIYLAYERMWDGNDLYWIQSHGSSSSNLAEAGTWPATEAEEARAKGYQVWPKRYIDARSRTVVQSCKLDHKKALRSVGLKLPKIKRQRIRRHVTHCHGCGRFLSERQVYGDCPNCGVSNAP